METGNWDSGKLTRQIVIDGAGVESWGATSAPLVGQNDRYVETCVRTAGVACPETLHVTGEPNEMRYIVEIP